MSLGIWLPPGTLLRLGSTLAETLGSFAEVAVTKDFPAGVREVLCVLEGSGPLPPETHTGG